MIRSRPFTIFAGIDAVPADLRAKEGPWRFLPWALRDAEVDEHEINEIETDLVTALNGDDEARVMLVLRSVADHLDTPVSKVVAEGRGHMDGGREWMLYVAA